MVPKPNNEPPAFDDSLDSDLISEDLGPGKSSPNRRDIASGESGDRTGMIRFVVDPDGVLVPDLKAILPGRGLWVAADRTALDKAATKGVFARAARKAVRVPEALSSGVHEALRARCLSLIGLARRSGALIHGFEKVADALKNGQVSWLIEARDSALDGRTKLLSILRNLEPRPGLVGCFEAGTLSAATGIETAVHMALKPTSQSRMIGIELKRLSGFEPLEPSEWLSG